ncbi:hypothetical protein HELRODRAFT_171477 [Helobdella robusta]|uniref:Endonuclease/exonuclease/phosphatase domain-containing protein n=1 Tax=Helobdella robusta TaxID=6412 RepID=T1F4C2_HELRO|nr:hypothetical protein HELRODRAFT_171477 [Helobdella robusta]ESO05803.1 hypothetical protein HELRODRAFT_171477 [Helobdella robusta]
MSNTSWTDVVKRNMNEVNKGITSVRKTIEVVNDFNERENSVVLFNFPENETVVKDRDNVTGFLMSLSDNALKHEEFVKINRQGRRLDSATSPRPIIVKFIDTAIKSMIMKKLFKIKLLDANMKSVKRIGRPVEDYKIFETCIKSNLNLGLLNIRSIRSKYDAVYELLSNGMDVFVLTETWHGSSNDLTIRLVKPEEFGYVDCVRPRDPATITPAFFNEIEIMLEQVSLGGDFVILAGDLNVHVERTDDDHAANLREIFELFNMRNRVYSCSWWYLGLVASSMEFPASACLVGPCEFLIKLFEKEIKAIVDIVAPQHLVASRNMPASPWFDDKSLFNAILRRIDSDQ